MCEWISSRALDHTKHQSNNPRKGEPPMLHTASAQWALEFPLMKEQSVAKRFFKSCPSWTITSLCLFTSFLHVGWLLVRFPRILELKSILEIILSHSLDNWTWAFHPASIISLSSLFLLVAFLPSPTTGLYFWSFGSLWLYKSDLEISTNQ